MKPTVGIICEYDPFHRGHARQFALIRSHHPQARIVCLMSGCFTQRGMPALFPPAFRAEAALRAGADIVLELPCAFAVRDAENFTLGAVSILTRLGFVTHLSFGLETEDLTPLQSIAALLEAPTPAFTAALRKALARGIPFAAAQAEAVAAALQVFSCQAGTGSILSAETAAQLLSQPNNILGICYLRALRRLHSPLIPLPVLRQGSYHAQTLAKSSYPSATAVRKAWLFGDIAAAQEACGYSLQNVPAHRPNALDTVLLGRLRSATAGELRALPDCSEGLENRLLTAARQATTRAELLALLKTRRYAYTRLNRLLAHALLGVQQELLTQHPLPETVRLLGFRKESRDLLSHFSESQIPVIAKAANSDPADPLYTLDVRAYDLWALGAGLPAGLMYRQQVVIL